MRIRWRLTLFGAAVTAAALIVFTILLNTLVAGGTASDQEELLTDLALDAAASIEETPGAALSGRRSPVVVDPDSSDQPFVIVVDPSGTVVYTEAPGSITLPAAVVVEALESGESGATSAGVRYQASSYAHPDLGPGVVAVGQSIRVPEEAIAGFQAFILVFGIITVLAAAVVSWLVTGRALRPLEQLAETADDIAGTGDITRRLPEAKSKDEVEALTTSFNGMLARLESTQAELERTLEGQKRFVADASHELRSPLTTIRSNAGFLRERTDASPSDRSDAIEDIDAEAERMTRLVNDLFALARSDSGEPLQTAPVDFGELVNDVVRKARHLDDRLQVSVATRVLVDGNRDALEQLIWILLDNAATHGDGAIVVDLVEQEDSAELLVRDHGPGVPQGQEEMIFDRFHQGDNSRETTGSGLGLAIARSIVAEHLGSIAAYNADGGGAVLKATIPTI